MTVPSRSQVEHLAMADEVSAESGTPGGGPLITRQEMGAELEINALVKRYGAFQAPGGMYGEFDQAMDLGAVLRATRAIEDAYNQAPAELRQEYPTWLDFVAAVETGKYQEKTVGAGEAPSGGSPAPTPAEGGTKPPA